MPKDTTDIDPILTLGHTLHATPNSHLLILGAGVSIAAGIPSAWGVQRALVDQLAAQLDEPAPADIEAWFHDRFGTPLRYQDLLEQLAPKATERQRLLRQFFEGDPGDGTPVLGEPSAAHRDVARLVARGHIRLIITLNFDHLVERALIEAGVQPTVVSSEAEFSGLAPVHLHDAVVVHLHGDYTRPESLRNTDDELAVYPRPVRRFLKRVLRDHAVITVGWSAAYDPALRAALEQSPSRHFTSYWVDPQPLNETAETLRRWLGAPLVAQTADRALGRLADATAALSDTKALHPSTVTVAVATTKRQLSGQATSIGLHDTIRIELDQVWRTLASIEDPNVVGDGGLTGFTTDDQAPDHLPGPPTAGDDTSGPRQSWLLERTRIAEALIATAAYWGTETTDQFWTASIERLARAAPAVVSSDQSALHRLPAVHLYTAALVSAVASRRWDLAVHLLREFWVPNPFHNKDQPAALDLSPSINGPKGQPPATFLYSHLRSLFTTELALGGDAYDDAIEMTDIVRLMASTHLKNSESSQRHRLAAVTAQQNMTSFQASVRNAADRDDPHASAAATARLRDGVAELDRALAGYASTVSIRAFPHVRVALGVGGPFDPGSPTMVRLVTEIERSMNQHTLARARLCGDDPITLLVTAKAVRKAIEDTAQQQLRFHSHIRDGGTAPWWCDSGERAQS